MTAMLTNKEKSTNQDQEKKKSKSKNPDVKCDHCNKKGHKADQCWIKHPELKPERGGRKDKSENPKYSMMATAGITKRQTNPDIWYTDSGASDHFSPHKALFESFHELEKPTIIETAEGNAVGTATGKITITVGENDDKIELQLNNVIYAPNMSSNLFSLMAAYDLGYETRITPGYGL